MGDFNSMILFRLGFLALHAAGFFLITGCVYGRLRTVLWYLAYLTFRIPLFTVTLAGQNAESPFYAPIAFFCMAIPWIALAWFLSRGCRGRRVFEILAFENLTVFHVAVPLWVHDLFPVFASTIGFQMAACALFFLVYLVFAKLLVAPARRLSASAPWGRFCVMSVVSGALLFATSFWPLSISDGDWAGGGVFLLAAVVVFSGYSMMLKSLAESVELARASEIVSRTKLLTSAISNRRSAQEEARRIRHDFRHHRIELEALLARGDAAGARAYLAGAFGALDVQTSRTWSRNELVDVLLSAYAERAAARNLWFEATADVPETLLIDSNDLVSLIGNLVENAVNASAGLVRVALHHKKGKLGLSITNSVPPGFRLEDGLPCAEPGIGLLSIREVLRRHHGDLRYRLESEEVLVCEAVMQDR